MSEVDEMKKAIAASMQQQNETQQRINQAIDQVDRDRKAKRDQSARPD